MAGGKVTSLEGKIPRPQPNLQVISVDSVSGTYLGRQERYNPDLLAARKGGLGIYVKMLQDEQVKAVVKFKRDAIIGRGYQFVFGDTKLGEEEQKRRIRVMHEITRRVNGSFVDGVVAVLRGQVMGFSLTEFVTQVIDVDGASFIGLAALLPRDPTTFKFYTDDFGSLLKFVQVVGSTERELDITRFVHYVQNPEVDPYYGESELRAAYRPWFLKDLSHKLWAAYLERMAGGFLAISLNESGLKPGHPDYEALQNVLQNARSTMGVILPSTVTAEMHLPPATDAYEQAVQHHDLAIAKALLIPNLLGLSHTGQTGAYSQSQTQLETFFMTLATDTVRLEEAVNDQLFRRLARLNWDDGEFPEFRFKRTTEDRLKWIIDAWKNLTSSNDVIPTEADEAHLRELLDFPPRDDSDEALAKVKQDLVPIQIDPNKQFSPAGQPGGQGQGDGKAFTEEDAKRLIAEAVANQQPKTEPAAADKKKFSLDAAMLRVDFAVMDQKATALEADVSDKVAMLATRATRDLITAEKLTELLDKDTQDIGALRISDVDTGRIKAAFKSGLERGWATGLNQAMVEVSKARKATFSKADRQVHFKALREDAADFFESNAFRMAGNLTDGMRAIIQQELLSGVKGNKRAEEVAANIYARLIRKGFTTLASVLTEEPRDEVRRMTEELLSDALNVANVPAYLNTLVRTNTFEAMNEARYAEFTDPAVADFVVALQYSAILDDRTTDICRALDGHVHTEASGVWEIYRPPNHYNCRSILFAVTTLDGWDGQESQAPTIEPQDGFK